MTKSLDSRAYEWDVPEEEVEVIEETVEKFLKFDSGKAMPELMDPEFLLMCGRVMAMGMKKYGRDNWKLCDDPSRCLGALFRHLLAAMEDPSSLDEESGLPHLAHAAINCMMAWRTAQLCEAADG